MTDYDLIILNAVLVTDRETKDCDISIKNEKIFSIEPAGMLKDAKAGRVVDAEGGYVMVSNQSSC